MECYKSFWVKIVHPCRSDQQLCSIRKPSQHLFKNLVTCALRICIDQQSMLSLIAKVK